MQMKCCSRCRSERPLSDYHIRRASKDGLSAACKTCLSLYDKCRANAPHRLKARADYLLTDAGKAASEKAKRRFTERYPAKRKAHVIVGNFLRDGKIKRPDYCEKCHRTVKPQAHHCDYTKPLEIMWLCTKCHADWHRTNTPIYGDVNHHA